tara:strand:+ start:802 stop:1038 length:237 start_codon:yes stop_codon:yes gene_type:complete
MKIDLTVREATLIYELLHEIKLKCVTEGAAKKDRQQSKKIIEECNGLMKKVEASVLEPFVDSHPPRRKKKKASAKGDK